MSAISAIGAGVALAQAPAPTGQAAATSNMSIIPTGTNSSFDPEAIKMLAAAFDDAWEAVQRSGGTLSRPSYAGAIREVLAKRIIEMAQRGQTNPQRLSEDALQFLAMNYRD